MQFYKSALQHLHNALCWWQSVYLPSSIFITPSADDSLYICPLLNWISMVSSQILWQVWMLDNWQLYWRRMQLWKAYISQQVKAQRELHFPRWVFYTKLFSSVHVNDISHTSHYFKKNRFYVILPFPLSVSVLEHKGVRMNFLKNLLWHSNIPVIAHQIIIHGYFSVS